MGYDLLCRGLSGVSRRLDVYTDGEGLLVRDGTDVTFPGLETVQKMRPLREGELPEDTMEELYTMIKRGNGAHAKSQ